jgi:hypothetical protein
LPPLALLIVLDLKGQPLPALEITARDVEALARRRGVVARGLHDGVGALR